MTKILELIDRAYREKKTVSSVQGADTKVFTMKVPKDLDEQTNDFAKKIGLKRADIYRMAVRDFLKKYKKHLTEDAK